jgi:hypothetical protein
MDEEIDSDPSAEGKSENSSSDSENEGKRRWRKPLFERKTRSRTLPERETVCCFVIAFWFMICSLF